MAIELAEPQVQPREHGLAQNDEHFHAHKPVAKKQALRLVSTKDLSRQDWLEVRRLGIGSSDAAAAVGLNPYCSALSLWLDKTGRDTGPEPDPEDDNSPLYWGTMLEHLVAAQYTKRTGNRVRRINSVLQHPQYPWMLANLDREVVGCADVQILECKTTGINGAKLWRDGVPEYVQIQVMHQLAVTGKQAADVAVLMGGHDFQVHRIERDEDMIAQLIRLEADFWQCVLLDKAPAADGSASADEALRRLYPHDSGQVLDWRGDTQANAAYSDLLTVRQQMKQLSQTESQLKQQLQERLGEASKALLDGGEISFKRSKDGVQFDSKALKEAMPDVYARFLQPKAGSRRFLMQEGRAQ